MGEVMRPDVLVSRLALLERLAAAGVPEDSATRRPPRRKRGWSIGVYFWNEKESGPDAAIFWTDGMEGFERATCRLEPHELNPQQRRLALDASRALIRKHMAEVLRLPKRDEELK